MKLVIDIYIKCNVSFIFDINMKICQYVILMQGIIYLVEDI